MGGSIQVKEMENKFIKIEQIGLGGAGAGGLGVAQIETESLEQFRDLSRGEKVYFTEVFYANGNVADTYKITFWSFIENRAGLVIYEETYHYSWYTISKHTPDYLEFKNDNMGWIVIINIIVIIVWFFISALINDNII